MNSIWIPSSEWQWVIVILLAIFGIIIAVFIPLWFYRRQLKDPEARLKKQLWAKIRDLSTLESLYDFSKDHDFTLVLLSYLNFTRQVIAFCTPAPDALPSLLKSKYTFGEKADQGAENTVPEFWIDRLKKLRLAGDGDIIWRAVKEKVRKGERFTKLFVHHGLWHKVWRVFCILTRKGDEIGKLPNIGVVITGEGKEGREEFVLGAFLAEYQECLKKQEVRDYLLYLMNKEKRGPEEEEALADIIVYLYWSEYRDCFNEASQPWGATLHDIVKFAKFPLKIVEPRTLRTVERIISGEKVFISSTGGGAWLLEYTVNYLHNLPKEKDLSYGSLIGKEKWLDRPGAPKDYDDFWKKLDEINATQSLVFFFQHPFQDRVLWEIARGENLRLPAEMLANRKAFLKRYNNEGGIQVIWYREPFFHVGHMQRLDIDERGKDKFDFYYQIYPSFGRTRLNSRVIASGAPLWEDKGIVYRILGEEPFRFGDSQGKIIENMRHKTGMDKHHGEIELHYISNVQMDTRETLRRQLTIHKFLGKCQKGDFDTASKDFLRLPWLPYYEFDAGSDPLNELREIDFADPSTWKGTGLLTLFSHESELAYKVLAAVKILKESFTRALDETRLRDEKNPSLADSENLIEDYAGEYTREMESFCSFLEYVTTKLNFNSTILEQFKNASEVIRGNLEKLKAVRRAVWINESGFGDVFRRLNEKP